jgi:hypothetical protein
MFNFFHPFRLVGVRIPSLELDDVYEYGFSFDLTTELYYYVYDWGSGIRFRLFGFGLDICLLMR